MRLKTLFHCLHSSRDQSACKTQLDLMRDEISAGCMIISSEASDVARVAIRGHLVDRVSPLVATPKCQLPVLLACKALGLSGEKIEKILANGGSHNVKKGIASGFHSTWHWGEEEVYFVQILSTYV
jgi:hypothetical protein